MGLSGTQAYPSAKRRLRLGIVGGGGTALVGQWHWTGVRLSNRWDLVAGALSSDPERAQAFGRDWFLPQDRIYSDYKNNTTYLKYKNIFDNYLKTNNTQK